jgi:DNA-binding LytR/AlgR family response regulator
MKLKCLLVDDEPPALEVLKTYLEAMDHLELAGACFNALEAMQVLQKQPVDVIFLDIKMPRLLGTELIRTLRHPPKVIFTTAYKEYALEGYDLDVVDYLLKPFSFERFVRAVNKITAGGPPGKEETEPPSEDSPPFLYFRADRKMVKIALDEIIYIESLKDYSRIVRTTERPLMVKKTISSIEEMLPDNLFVRIHRSFIVAIHKVTAYTNNDIEIGGQEIPIGKLYRAQLPRLALAGRGPTPDKA